jgi:hypothetical protein
MLSFRKSGPSGRGEGRIRYYVDHNDRCIGSVEGKTGDYSLDFDRSGTQRYHTRQEAAEALLAATTAAAQPPIGRAEYSVLVQCKSGGLPASSPSLSMARMLASRGLLKDGRRPQDYRTTPAGRKAIERYDRWEQSRTAPRAATTTTSQGDPQ